MLVTKIILFHLEIGSLHYEKTKTSFVVTYLFPEKKKWRWGIIISLNYKRTSLKYINMSASFLICPFAFPSFPTFVFFRS